MSGLTYKAAGVDIDQEEEAISALRNAVLFAREGKGAPLKSEFTGLVDFGDFALSLCTDGVGTKLLVANKMEKWDTIGIDCIAMNVNDTICQGAEPIAFVDYLAIEETDAELTKEIGKGLQKGAEMSNMTIIGGETATLGDIIEGFDIAGTALGYVKKDEVIDGSNVKPGDKIIGIPSSGIHSNGLTLARKIVKRSEFDYEDEAEFGVIGEELLEPTKIYVETVMKVLEEHEIKGAANITGGGLKNVSRINDSYRYVIEEPIEPQPIFEFLQEEGSVKDEEMYRTFNMGMGFCMVTSSEAAEDVADSVDGKVVGSVEKGEGVIHEEKGLEY
ncbi:MAG: phosphoribosylformylglycinamidine cyclo-ligase [Candidatus Thermoplasmatota archaeon]|nr:phosphoribosylformylglycinamidine cyclo-ligase [Candidatus Thermoplasmatota archaeon]